MFYPPLSYKTALYETHDSREHIFAGNFPNHLHLDSTSAETENTWKSRSPTRSTTFASLLSNSPSGFRDRFPLHQSIPWCTFWEFREHSSCRNGAGKTFPLCSSTPFVSAPGKTTERKTLRSRLTRDVLSRIARNSVY